MRNVSALDPLGYAPTVTGKLLAPRLETLAGKRVCLVNCRFDNSGDVIEQLAAWFRDHLPEVETPVFHWDGEGWTEDTELLAEVGATGDAAILGVGL